MRQLDVAYRCRSHTVSAAEANPVANVGGYVLEELLWELIDWCAHDARLVDELATLSEAITRLRTDADNESELDAVNDQLVDVYRRLSSGEIARVAPLRLWIPLRRRPHDEPVDKLIHLRGRGRGWPNYDLKVVGEFGERTILLGDIKVEPGHETRGLGSAVLADLCAYADHHGLTVIGMFQPDVEGVGDRSQRTERWYRRHGFNFEGGRMTRPPRVPV